MVPASNSPRQEGEVSTGWNISLSVLGLLLLLLLFLYRDTFMLLTGLWSQWEEGGYSHGYLVLLISCYIIYSTRGVLARMVPCPCLPALLFVAAFGLLWSVAAMVSIQLLQTAALLPLFMSLIWAVLGTPIARQLLLPVMFIGFAIPVWAPLLPLLQNITAESAFWMARVYGIPAFFQDFTIHLPSGQLLIREACGGLHYFLAGITLGTFYAWLNYRRWSHRLLVIMTAAGLAILVNILRVFIITVLAYRTEMQHPYVRDHLMLGWYLFGGLVVVLLVIDLLVGRPAAGGHGDLALPSAKNCKYNYAQLGLIFSVTTVTIAAGPLFAGWVTDQARHTGLQELRLPDGMAGWQGPLVVNDSWQPEYRGAISKKGVYRKVDTSVYLYIGYYPRQSQGAELVNVLNRIGTTGAWQAGRSVRVDPGEGRPRLIEAELLSPLGEKRLVWYRYRVAGRYTTNDSVAKLLQVKGLLTGRTDAAVVAIATDAGNDVPGARERLGDFMFLMDKSLARTADGEM